MQFVRSHQILGLLCDLAVFRREQFRAYRCIQDIQQDLGEPAILTGIRIVAYQMAHQCLRDRCVDRIHGHMIAIVGCPSKRQFRQITRSDNHTAGLVCDIHNDLGTLSRLTVFVCHIMVFHIMSDIPEMDCYRFADIYFPQCCPQFFRKVAGIPIRSVCGSETRHRNCGDLFSRHAEEIKCSGCHQQCQCGIKSAGDTDDSALAVSVFQTFLQSHRLDRQDLVTSFFTLFFS